MRVLGFGLFACILAISAVGAAGAADDEKWSTIKGKVVLTGVIPAQPAIALGANPPGCLKGGNPPAEDYIVNPKNKGLKNVFVWIEPAGAKRGTPFPVNMIHKELVKPAKSIVEIDQPCCNFIPHVLAAQAGQKIVIKNSATFAHNAKWSSEKNGDINPLIVAGGKFEFEKALVLEPSEITLQCNLHGWMKAHVRVFDHPYFTVTDDDGNFEIKNAPVGKFNLYVHHPATGWLGGAKGRSGQPLEIKAGGTDAGTMEMK